MHELTLHTVGHSTLPAHELVALLRDRGVDAVADVRSVPTSRIAPQHDRAALAATLQAAGIGYVWLGAALGGRPGPGQVRDDGRADYAAMAATDVFATALARLVDGARRMAVAALCAERDATDCHRRLLVGRALAEPSTRPDRLGDVILAHLDPVRGDWSEPAEQLCGQPDLFGQRPWASAAPAVRA